MHVLLLLQRMNSGCFLTRWPPFPVFSPSIIRGFGAPDGPNRSLKGVGGSTDLQVEVCSN